MTDKDKLNAFLCMSALLVCALFVALASYQNELIADLRHDLERLRSDIASGSNMCEQ